MSLTARQAQLLTLTELDNAITHAHPALLLLLKHQATSYLANLAAQQVTQCLSVVRLTLPCRCQFGSSLSQLTRCRQLLMGAPGELNIVNRGKVLQGKRPRAMELSCSFKERAESSLFRVFCTIGLYYCSYVDRLERQNT